MKIAVIGAGAAGSLFGGSLSAAGYQVVMIDTDMEKIRAIKKNGIEIRFSGHGLSMSRTINANPYAAVFNPKDKAGAEADYYLFCVKAYSTRKAAESVFPHAGKKSIAVTLQNGAGNLQNLALYFDKENIAGGTTSEGAVLQSPGKIIHGGRGVTNLSMLINSEKQRIRLTPLITALKKAGFKADYHDNIMELIWRKLAVNASINPLTALTGKQNGIVFQSPHLKFLSEKITFECADAAAEEGISLDPDRLYKHVLDTAEKTSRNFSSMLQDIRGGRKTEIDYISGAVEDVLKEKNRRETTFSGIMRLLVKALEQKGFT